MKSKPSEIPIEAQHNCGKVCPLVQYLLKKPPLWIPLALLAVLTLIFRFTNLDLYLAGLFFNAKSPNSPWPLGNTEPWLWLYRYGIYPAWILGMGGLAVWLLSFSWKKLQPIRREGLFLALMLIIGPGILVNGLCKPYCGRPRPILTKPFGGEKDFLLVLSMGNNVKGDCNSFPSGHATTGFYLMAPAFVLYRRRPGWAAAFLLFGLAAGFTMGIARMAAGGHFASDVIWAGGIVYFTGLTLAGIFKFGMRGKCSDSFSPEPMATVFG
jgi:lipid A 4'-phosphatase